MYEYYGVRFHGCGKRTPCKVATIVVGSGLMMGSIIIGCMTKDVSSAMGMRNYYMVQIATFIGFLGLGLVTYGGVKSIGENETSPPIQHVESESESESENTRSNSSLLDTYTLESMDYPSNYASMN